MNIAQGNNSYFLIYTLYSLHKRQTGTPMVEEYNFVLTRHLMQVRYDGHIITVSDGWDRRGHNKCQSQHLKTNLYLMWCLFAQIVLHS